MQNPGVRRRRFIGSVCAQVLHCPSFFAPARPGCPREIRRPGLIMRLLAPHGVRTGAHRNRQERGPPGTPHGNRGQDTDKAHTASLVPYSGMEEGRFEPPLCPSGLLPPRPSQAKRGHSAAGSQPPVLGTKRIRDRPRPCSHPPTPPPAVTCSPVFHVSGTRGQAHMRPQAPREGGAHRCKRYRTSLERAGVAQRRPGRAGVVLGCFARSRSPGTLSVTGSRVRAPPAPVAQCSLSTSGPRALAVARIVWSENGRLWGNRTYWCWRLRISATVFDLAIEIELFEPHPTETVQYAVKRRTHRHDPQGSPGPRAQHKGSHTRDHLIKRSHIRARKRTARPRSRASRYCTGSIVARRYVTSSFKCKKKIPARAPPCLCKPWPPPLCPPVPPPRHAWKTPLV